MQRAFFKTYIPFPTVCKRWLLVAFGATVGRNVTIKPDVNIKFPWFLEVGSNVWIGESVWIDNLANVKIGDNVCLSQGSYLLTGNHNYKKETFDLIVGSIHIEEGVWVGARAIICPGVNLRSHSVISVGSVMNKDTDAYTIYSGNPALPIRKREIT
ncbi:MAG: WcaF family extracellular polysaccharide biosynthesis acetyltransferase [Pyrinomonadaceae bacterium]